MALVVADTDVLIDALAGRDPTADRVALGIESGTLATTAVTAFELLSGAGSESVREAVKSLLAAMSVLPFDDVAGGVAAEVRRDLEARGTAIGMADYLIAGICLARSARLLTRNIGHFSRVTGLGLDPLFEE